MSIFLGKLNKYWKNQNPIDFLTYTESYNDPEFKPENMIFSKDENKNKEFLERFNDSKESFLKKIKFIRITEKLEIFNEEFNCTTFRQGKIGDCYLIDVISNLSNYGHILTQIFRIDKSNKQGYYEICLFLEGEWQIVIIDDLIPFYTLEVEKGNFLYMPFLSFFTGKTKACCYFMLLEKAFAKVKGSFIDLESGFSHHIYEALTGFKANIYKHYESKGVFYKNGKIQFIDFNTIYNGIRQYGYFFSCGSRKEFVGEEHAFSIICADIQKYSNDKKVNVLEIRNPWGHTKIKDSNGNIIQIRSKFPNYEESPLLKKQYEQFLSCEENGIIWIDDENYFKHFEDTSICYSMLGSSVYSFKFINKDKTNDYTVFMKPNGKLVFKLILEKNARVILASFSNMKEFENYFQIYDMDKQVFYELNNEFNLKKGKYLVFYSFENIDISKDISLLISLYCYEKLIFEFIKNITFNESGILYKQIFDSYPMTLKRIKIGKYKHCEDLREKFLYHKTLINFFREKLGCEFSLNGLGFYIDTLKNDQVNCMIRIDKTQKSKFKQIVVSEKIEHNNLPTKKLYVGTSHINGEVIGEGEVWQVKKINEEKTVANSEQEEEPKLLFRGEIKKNEPNKEKNEINENNNIYNNTSEFQEDIYDNLEYEKEDEEEEQDDENSRTVSMVEIEGSDTNDEIINIMSRLTIHNKYKWKKKSSLHEHQLVLCKTERILGCGWYCNRCKKHYDKSEPSYYCTLCDFDICKDCIKENNFIEESIKGEYNIEGLFFQFKSKAHLHPLTYLTIIRKAKWKCDKCPNNTSKIFDAEKYFYFCSACEYYMCDNCKQKEKAGNQYQLSCLWHKDHPLSFCLPFRGSFDFICDHCEKAESKNVNFYCTNCDYSLCIKCYSKYIDNFKNDEIRNENNNLDISKKDDKSKFQLTIDRDAHPLVKCVVILRYSNELYFKCFICEKKFNNIDFLYLCSICDKKYCLDCINRLQNDKNKSSN